MKHTPDFGFTKTLSGLSFDVAVQRVTEVLKTQGFGVITEIDMKENFKKKIDVDFRNYKILGVCQPKLSHKVLESDPFMGLLMPCNAVVFDGDEGEPVVSISKPEAMFSIAGHQGMEDVLSDVTGKIQRVIEAL